MPAIVSADREELRGTRTKWFNQTFKDFSTKITTHELLN